MTMEDVRQLEAIMRDRSVSSSKPRSNFSSLNVKTRYRRVHSSIGASIVDPSKTAFFLNTEVASMHLWQSYSLAWAKPNSAPKNCASRLRSEAPDNWRSLTLPLHGHGMALQERPEKCCKRSEERREGKEVVISCKT